MNQDKLNSIRRAAGVRESFDAAERKRLLEDEEKKVKDKESSKEAEEGGSKFDPKGGDKMPKEGDDVRHKNGDPDDKDKDKKVKETFDYDEDTTLEEKKADKDYDGDGEIESGEDEYKGAKDKAIKKAMQKDKVKEGAEEVTVWGKDYGHDDGKIDRDESPDQVATQDHAAKQSVKVPGKYKTALKEEIKQLRKEAERVTLSDPNGSELYFHTADAFEMLLGHLEEGSRRSLNLAQIDMNRIMSPMVQRIPNELYMFIVRGGKPAALNELFKEIKVKNKTGADLSKDDYTK